METEKKQIWGKGIIGEGLGRINRGEALVGWDVMYERRRCGPDKVCICDDFNQPIHLYNSAFRDVIGRPCSQNILRCP